MINYTHKGLLRPGKDKIKNPNNMLRFYKVLSASPITCYLSRTDSAVYDTAHGFFHHTDY